MRWVVLVVACLLGTTARGDGEAGQFDYYVLSLSWSPNWCDRVGNARGSAQCDRDPGLGWMLHGLWPQYETGWPNDCPTQHDEPSAQLAQTMADIQGTASLAAHEWRKHGTCSGLSPQGYFDLSRQAFEAITLPDRLQSLAQTTTLPALDIEAMFLTANPALTANGVTITCRSGQIQEARICLTKDLTPRACGADVQRDCTLDRAIMHPIR